MTFDSILLVSHTKCTPYPTTPSPHTHSAEGAHGRFKIYEFCRRFLRHWGCCQQIGSVACTYCCQHRASTGIKSPLLDRRHLQCGRIMYIDDRATSDQYTTLRLPALPCLPICGTAEPGPTPAGTPVVRALPPLLEQHIPRRSGPPSTAYPFGIRPAGGARRGRRGTRRWPIVGGSDGHHRAQSERDAGDDACRGGSGWSRLARLNWSVAWSHLRCR
jgi:hypothetical protein